MECNFAQLWLNILQKTLPETHSAIFVTQNSNNQTIQPIAKWPENLTEFDDFAQIIKYALVKNEPVSVLNVQQVDKNQYDYFALPVLIEAVFSGIIILKIKHSPTGLQEEAIFKTLQQGTQWLALANPSQYQQKGFYASVINLLTTCFEQKSYREMLIALVSEMTQSLHCERVALGEYENRHCKVVAISNSAQFDVRSNFMQKTADVMDEAIEQDNLIVFPNTQTVAITRAHQELARKFGSGSLLTIPMINKSDIFGALMLSRNEDQPFDLGEINLLKQTILLITPFLYLKKQDELALTTKIFKTLHRRLIGLLGFKHLKTKLAALCLTTLLLAMGLLKGNFQVTADAVLEGRMQRVIPAPIDGFLISASVRAGDTVRKGDLMASLDDAELQLELGKLNGQLQKFRREYREALSTSDLVKVRVISAEIDQAAAEMELTQQQLQKISLTAPFDSVVIEGDLSQMLGSPVERGDTLFKIAPLEGYRIILKVDERLISFVQVGQKGLLALSSMPERKFMLTVQKITAVAKVDNKENIFRVEASLDNAPDLLRPGMEGIGKINVGRQNLLWIWTHELMDWLRLWFWSWSF
ncbi:putative GAF sensor protein [Methyloglobulus morosus KoM1]|uniref:Putative GAF sensor protein n=1 Tax=Methyloglobulus morosus KoM1 TaxID=1116472 RepID=V5BXW6_9GAMM|nr:HlyD family efflux transporter periplasmic adaptor subunit [Methyloglobulus morosus]ESS72689.1 putative GAF sensor protein [Methyloglobulus morosus KoM1]